MDEREELLLQIRATLNEATNYLKIISGISIYGVICFTGIAIKLGF